MKEKLVCLASVLTVSSAYSYTVSVNNFPVVDRTAVPIIDNTGTLIEANGGYVAVGTFATAPATFEDVASTFVVFGDGVSTFENALLGDSAAGGFFAVARSAPIAFQSAAPPVGESIYVVLGNGSDLASSTQFAVLDSGDVFGTDLQAGSGAFDLNIDSDFVNDSSLIIGEIRTTYDTGLGLVTDEAIVLAGEAIPEPSTSLLAALAGLALAARRRR